MTAGTTPAPSVERTAVGGRATVAPAAAPGTGRRSGDRVDVSILVPAKDEEANLAPFMEQVEAAMRGSGISFEVVVIDDGSVDATWSVLETLVAQYPFLHRVRHRRQRGIADALRTGYLHATGDVLVFYPADLQYRPEDIPQLVRPILAGESDMVTGQKQGRYEKAFVSRVYNWLNRSLFDVPVRDLNSVKAYRREIMEILPIRPDWHRYMIVIAAVEGYTVSEIPVPLYPRAAGRSKFGRSRIFVGVLDLLSVWFELRFGRKPLLLFGLLGAALFLVGVLTGIVALLVRFVIPPYEGFRPLLNLIELCLILGFLSFATGLLGEQIAGQRAELQEMRRRLDEQDEDRGA